MSVAGPEEEATRRILALAGLTDDEQVSPEAADGQCDEPAAAAVEEEDDTDLPAFIKSVPGWVHSARSLDQGDGNLRQFWSEPGYAQVVLFSGGVAEVQR
ncbi:hypothetical protein [Streptosporangium sp. NPDC002607]